MTVFGDEACREAVTIKGGGRGVGGSQSNGVLTRGSQRAGARALPLRASRAKTEASAETQPARTWELEPGGNHLGASSHAGCGILQPQQSDTVAVHPGGRSFWAQLGGAWPTQDKTPGEKARKKAALLGDPIPAAELTGRGWAGVWPGPSTALGRGREEAALPEALPGLPRARSWLRRPQRPSSPDSVPTPSPTAQQRLARTPSHAGPGTVPFPHACPGKPPQPPSPTSPPSCHRVSGSPQCGRHPVGLPTRPAAACGATACADAPPVTVEVAWLPSGPESLGSARSWEPPSIRPATCPCPVCRPGLRSTSGQRVEARHPAPPGSTHRLARFPRTLAAWALRARRCHPTPPGSPIPDPLAPLPRALATIGAGRQPHLPAPSPPRPLTHLPSVPGGPGLVYGDRCLHVPGFLPIRQPEHLGGAGGHCTGRPRRLPGMPPLPSTPCPPPGGGAVQLRRIEAACLEEASGPKEAQTWRMRCWLTKHSSLRGTRDPDGHRWSRGHLPAYRRED